MMPASRPNPTLFLALPALLAIPVLLAATSGETAIQPRALVGVAAVLLVAALAGLGLGEGRRWIDLSASATLGIAASHLLFAPGLPWGHDTFHHLWGVWAMSREIGWDNPLPLWLHGIGFGLPLLELYGPAGFYVALPFSLAGLGPAAALKGAFLAFGALGAAGMNAAVLSWTGDRRAALVAAAAYAFAPYRLLDQHYRAAFGESAGMAVFPFLFLLGTEAMRAGGRRRMAAGMVITALLFVTHPISALIGAAGLGIWALAIPGRLRAVSRLAGIWLGGAALAGFFLLPFAAGLRHTGLGGLAMGDEKSLFETHGLAPADLLERRLWTHLDISLPSTDPQEGTDAEMPFYFGLVLLALVPLGAFARRDASRPLAWLTASALAVTLKPVAGALLLVVPSLAVLQFPWRFLGLAAFGASALAGLAAARLLELGQGRLWKALVPGALAALLVFDAFPFTGAPGWLPVRQDLASPREPHPLRAAGLVLPSEDDTSYFCCAYSEFSPRPAWNRVTSARDRAVLVRAGVGLVVEPGSQTSVRLPAEPYAVQRWDSGRARALTRFTRSQGEITVELERDAGAVAGRVEILEAFYPGWQVWREDGWRDVEPTADGFLQARVEPGAPGSRTTVRFRFHRWTRVRTAGRLLTGAAAAVLMACVGWPRRRAAPPPGPAGTAEPAARPAP